MKNYLEHADLCSCLVIDVGRCHPLWAAPFPRQGEPEQCKKSENLAENK